MEEEQVKHDELLYSHIFNGSSSDVCTSLFLDTV